MTERPLTEIQPMSLTAVVTSAVRNTPGVQNPLPPLLKTIIRNVVRELHATGLDGELYATQQRPANAEMTVDVLMQCVAAQREQTERTRNHLLKELTERDDYVSHLQDQVAALEAKLSNTEQLLRAAERKS